jgi:hypothetical protein
MEGLMSDEVFDPETADLAELQRRILAGEGVEEPEHTEPEPEKTEKVEPEPEEPETEQTVYRREIDLGDGSGKQVFEAESIESLVDKLAQAQEHATRKIRELSQKKPEQKAPERTDQDKWLRSQQVLADPDAVIDEQIERRLGKDFQKRMERLAAFEKAQTEDANAKQWMAAKTDYYACPENGKKIEKYIQKFFDGDGSIENIEKAYTDLSESGLLRLKPGPKEKEEGTEARIAPTGQTKKASSGLSSKRSVTRAPEPTEEELYAMPYDKLRELAKSENQ